MEDKTIEKLNQALDPKMVKTRQGGGKKQLSYIEGWQAEENANKIFNYNWDKEIKNQEELYKRDYIKEVKDWDTGKKVNKEMFEVAYKCKVRVYARIGDKEVFREGVGFGNGQSARDLPSQAYELALKGSETDALKRALKSLGKQFGLSLYDKDIDIIATYLKGSAMSVELTEALEQVAKCKDNKEIRALYKEYDGAYRDDFDKACNARKEEIKNENS